MPILPKVANSEAVSIVRSVPGVVRVERPLQGVSAAHFNNRGHHRRSHLRVMHKFQPGRQKPYHSAVDMAE